MNSFRVSKSVDTDRARQFVGPDLDQTGYKCYQQTALVVKELIHIMVNYFIE